MLDIKTAKNQHIVPIAFLAVGIIALNTFGLFSQPFFRDFAIVFEGGYRIYKGQIPFRDFFIPLGPVCLYLQAFFNFIVGPNLYASALHAGTLAAVLSVLFYLVTVEKNGKPSALLLGVTLFFAYTGIINYPWYNECAYFFFLLNVLLLIRKLDTPLLSPRLLTTSAALAVLGIFSKQDVGMLHFILIGGYLASHQNIRKTILHYVLPTIVLASALVLFFQSYGDFLHWFNHGQRPLGTRVGFLNNPIALLSHFRTWLLALCIWFYFLGNLTVADKKRLYLIFILLLTPFITTHTSGVPEQTAPQGIPIALFLGGELILNRFFFKQTEIHKKLRVGYVVLAILAVNTFPMLTRYALGNFFVGNDASQPQWIQKLLTHYKYSNHIKIPSGSYRHCLMPLNNYAYFETIRAILMRANGSFFNMSEYTFLYADFNKEPPRGFPLWFHHGTSYFDEDFQLLQNQVMERKPKVILVQDAHTNQRLSIKVELMRYYLERGYLYILPTNTGIEVLMWPD